MTSKSEQIKGTPLKDKPAKIARCGMSHTKFAQHRSSKQWFKLSIQGKIQVHLLNLIFIVKITLTVQIDAPGLKLDN